MRNLRTLTIGLAVALVSCATTKEHSSITGLPAGLQEKIRELSGPNTTPCGVVDVSNDADRLAKYECVRIAASEKKSFWLADSQIASGGFGFAWIGSSSGKVYQLLSMGKNLLPAECRAFEVTRDNGIHCSI